MFFVERFIILQHLIATTHAQVDVKNCTGLPYELFKEAVYQSRGETTALKNNNVTQISF